MNNRYLSRFLPILLAILTAAAGGFIFKLLHIPIPWLLGPTAAVLIGSNVNPGRYEWPPLLRNAGIVTVGYAIGLSLTAQALGEISRQLPYMLLMTVLLLGFCAGMAVVVSRLSGVDFRTSLLAAIPGGLTQVLLLAEETEGVNLTVVTVTQVLRIMLIVVCVPLLIFSPLFGGETADLAAGAIPQAALSPGWSSLFPNILYFAPVITAAAILADRIRFPTAYLLGPAIAASALQLAGVHGPDLPPALVNAAQLLIGAYIGMLLKPGQLPNKTKTIALAIGSGLLLIAGALGLSALLQKVQPITSATGLLSLAPGGMDQMGVIAHEIGADLSIVAGYQIFRLFFIFFAVPPLVRLLFALTSPKARQHNRRQ